MCKVDSSSGSNLCNVVGLQLPSGVWRRESIRLGVVLWASCRGDENRRAKRGGDGVDRVSIKAEQSPDFVARIKAQQQRRRLPLGFNTYSPQHRNVIEGVGE